MLTELHELRAARLAAIDERDWIAAAYYAQEIRRLTTEG